MDDMESYEALLEEPVFIRYNDFDVYSTPLPSGGPQMLFILNIMEDIGLSPESEWKNLTYQHLVEVRPELFTSFTFSFVINSLSSTHLHLEVSLKILIVLIVKQKNFKSYKQKY